MAEFELIEDPFTEEEGFVQIVKLQMNIKNFEFRFLVADPETSSATFVPHANAKDEKTTFYLVLYKMLSGQESGQPVAVGCTVDNNDYLLSVENSSVILKESEAPDVITSEASEFIFYLRGAATSYISFESSEEPGFFLACSEEDSSLILKPYSKEELEERAIFLLESVRYTETAPSQKIQKKIQYNYWNIHIDLHSPPEGPSFESTESIEIPDLLNMFKPNISAKSIPYHIHNHMKDFLVADPENAIVTFESNGNEKDEQATFYVNKYRTSTVSDGLPVALSCKVHNNNYLLCAASESIILKLSELPTEIQGQSDLIFYLKEFSEGHSSARLEPLLDRKLSIACNLSEKKLILKQYKNEEIDETMEFILEDKTKST
ncbi:uncharacterized protein ACNLHF_019642 [Anomaloglossus baeobatrachus]|uniref:uncharacterized protein LOC142311406 n=1 Tax=Anomaloglossus baeobatrachus TaxID=238106 RepID=UPI003F4FDFBE